MKVSENAKKSCLCCFDFGEIIFSLHKSLIIIRAYNQKSVRSSVSKRES
jgi:hypothetical protein